METDVCERWRGGRASWRPAREPFDPSAYEVSTLTRDTEAKAYVVANHYARSMPPARFRFGLHGRGGGLVGVAVFSVPMHPAVLAPFAVEGRPTVDAVELGRLVLDDDVLGNAESYFVARCFELLRRAGVGGVVSFSDPQPRARADGGLVFAGHIGSCYAALNATYAGLSTARTQLLLPDATAFSPRALSKIRSGERGWRYATEQLVTHGARAPLDGEDPRAWLDEVLPTVTRAQRHHGNHRYLWGLTPAAKRMLPPSLAYPKFNTRACLAGVAANTTCAPLRHAV